MPSWRTVNNRRRSKRDRAIVARIRLRLMREMRAKSPEVTGVYQCECGNTTEFTGIDANGYGGPEVCECEASTYDDEGRLRSEETPECVCLTELSQDFTVLGPDRIDYKAFTGGGYDAEIGSYTTILCAVCGATIWEEQEQKAA